MPESQGHLLEPKDNERIFRTRIIPGELSAATQQQHPIVVFIGGQTGAGKTAVADMITNALGRRGGFINANMDFYTPYHPHYPRLARADEATASALVRPDTESWWVRAQEHAIRMRYDVVIETAMRSAAEFEELTGRFRRAGYQIDVAVMAVPSALSRLGVLSRYLGEVASTGVGRYVSPQVHDECYEGVARACRAVDTQDHADSVFLFRRDTSTAYRNQCHDGAWQAPAGTAEALEAERSRPWDDQEIAWFRGAFARAAEAVDDAHRADLEGVARLARPLLADSPVELKGSAPVGPPARRLEEILQRLERKRPLGPASGSRESSRRAARERREGPAPHGRDQRAGPSM